MKDYNKVSDINTFWIYNIEVLISNKSYTKLIPKRNMTKIEILNSLTRLMILIFIIIAILGYKEYYFIPLVAIIIIILVFYYYERFDNNKKELFNNKINKKCTRPTNNNPFMNPLIYEDSNKPEACDLTNEINEEIDIKLIENGYIDPDDIYRQRDTTRQFYTIPSTEIPNDQSGFARWLYDKPSCKEDNENCLKYEDVRTSQHNPDINNLNFMDNEYF